MPKGSIVLIASSNYEKSPGEITAFDDVLGVEIFSFIAIRASYVVNKMFIF